MIRYFILLAALLTGMTVRAQGLPTDGPLTVRPMLQQLGERLLKGKTGSIVAIISALLIFAKMQYQEGETAKNVMTLLGAILFVLGASAVFPAFFGYRT